MVSENQFHSVEKDPREIVYSSQLFSFPLEKHMEYIIAANLLKVLLLWLRFSSTEYFLFQEKIRIFSHVAKI